MNWFGGSHVDTELLAFHQALARVSQNAPSLFGVDAFWPASKPQRSAGLRRRVR
jgi:hypothetical protein